VLWGGSSPPRPLEAFRRPETVVLVKGSNMDQFVLVIDLGNEAMQTPADVGRALEKVAATLVVGDWNGLESGGIRDENGNTVGKFEVI
jgi:hypothetical protein